MGYVNSFNMVKTAALKKTCDFLEENTAIDGLEEFPRLNRFYRKVKTALQRTGGCARGGLDGECIATNACDIWGTETPMYTDCIMNAEVQRIIRCSFNGLDAITCSMQS